MRYIIFSRVSTDVQKCSNQIRECHLYVNTVKKHGDEVIEFSEEDTSTRIPVEDRVILQSMLKFLKKGDTLVVYKLDRIARKGSELVAIYEALKVKGVRVHSIQEPTADEEYIHIIAFVAMKERANCRARTISALNRKRADGERVGTTIFGYKLDETRISTYKNAKSEGKPYLLLENRQEQAALQRMICYYQKGLKYHEIARELNREGHVNRAGKPFAKMSIWRILKRLQRDKLVPMSASNG